jgi:hypothetical protein
MTKITCVCDHCKKEFLKSQRDINTSKRIGRTSMFCSRKCWYTHNSKTITRSCDQCGKSIVRRPCFFDKNKSGNFCSRSCSTKYQNSHKTAGYRRSKLEIYIESQLKIDFPELNILANDISTINAELDIFLPELKLAFELNGIFHYEPIYGHDKLERTQNNDQQKIVKMCRKWY